VKLGEFLTAVKKYRWTFVVTVATVLALGLIWLFLTPAKYVSTTRLMVSVEGATTADAYQNDDVVAGRVNTYVGLLTSDVVSQRVIEKLKLRETPRELASKINATAVQPRTSLIDIEVADGSAERAQQIAQTLAEQFVLYVEAMETPTGQDNQKVHTTVVTSATPAQGNAMVRTALGGIATLGALLLGACAVWIRSARDPELQLARSVAVGGEPLGDVVPSARPEPPARRLPPATEPPTSDLPSPRAHTPSTDAVASEVPSKPPRAIDLLEAFRQQWARVGSRAGRDLRQVDKSTADTADKPSKLTEPTVAERSRPAGSAASQHTAGPADAADIDKGLPLADLLRSEVTHAPARTHSRHSADPDTAAAETPPSDAEVPTDAAERADGLHRRPLEPAAATRANWAMPSTEKNATFGGAPQKSIDLVESYRRLRSRLQSKVERVGRAVRKRDVPRPATQATTTRTLTHTKASAQPEATTAESRERTPWLLCFLFLLIPILPAYLVPAGPLKSNGSPAKLMTIMCFALVILGFVLLRRTQAKRMIQPGVIFILLFFLLQLLVYGTGMIDPGDATVQASRTRALLNLLANVGLALFILVRIKTARERKILLGCLAVGLAYNCVVGLLQSMTHIDLRFYFQPPGFVFNTEDLELGTRSGVKRVLGTTLHAIEFSLVAAAAVPLAVYFSVYAKKRSARIGAMLLCVLALVSMPAAVSRTGVIGLAVALFVYMWNFKVRQIATAVVVGAAIVLGYIALAPSVATALWASITGAREDDSITSRLADYAQVSRTFHAHPIVGLGLGGSPPSEYGLLDNEWLQALVQGGILGVTAMLVLVTGGMFGLAAALRSATTPDERNQAYALGSMFMGILVCSYFFDLFGFQQATRIFFICFALMWSSYTIPISPPTTLDPGLLPPPPRKPASLAMNR
jgi:polysaccharide biosynthesis protein PslJ